MYVSIFATRQAWPSLAINFTLKYLQMEERRIAMLLRFSSALILIYQLLMETVAILPSTERLLHQDHLPQIPALDLLPRQIQAVVNFALWRLMI